MIRAGHFTIHNPRVHPDLISLWYFADIWGMISLNSAMKSFKHFKFLLPSCTLKAKYVTF